MKRYSPIFDTTEEAERLHDWFFALPDEEQNAYRKQKARENLIDEFKEGSGFAGHLILIAAFVGVAIDLLWRVWNTVAKTFPTWHVPLISLHQTAAICLLSGGAIISFKLAIGELRRLR